MNAARVAFERIKTIGKYQVFGLAMFTIGGVYVAVLITIPRLAYLAFRLM